MSTHKRINDKYTITSPEVVINGNLVIVGTTTNVSATNTEIKDNIVVLNKGETGNGITLGTAGISVDRGIATDVALLYSHTSNTWVLTNDGITYNDIVTTAFTGFLTEVADDPSPELGGNLDVLSYSIVSASGNINLAGPVKLETMNGAIPGWQPDDATVVYANTVSTGGTGIYVNNSEVVEKELVTKDRTLFWSLVL